VVLCIVTLCIRIRHLMLRLDVPLSHVNNSNTLKRLSEITFPSNTTRLPKQHCFCNVSRLRPFVLLVTVLRWSTGGMTLTTENLSTGRETCPSATLPTNFTWTEPGADDKPHDPWHVLLKAKITLHYILRPSPYRAVNTLRLVYKNQSLNVV